MRRKILAVFVLCALGAVFGIKLATSSPAEVITPGLKQFSAEQLKEFDGSDPEQPIYLAMDGFVYDVTLGKEFYQPGGAYHYLAGKDSSGPLSLAGGAIIKRKYKVIGILKQ